MTVWIAWILVGAISQVLASGAIRSIQAHARSILGAVVANYAAACVVAGGLWLHAGSGGMTARVVGCGAFTGFFYTAALLSIVRSMGQRGMALTVATASLSLLVPTMIAVVGGEALSVAQQAGIAVAAMATPLLALSTSTGSAIRERPSPAMAALLFVLQGCAMSGNLLASRRLEAAQQPAYLFALFAFGLAFAAAMHLRRRAPGIPRDLVRGAWFGVTNIGSTVAILTGLEHVPGSVFFAAMGVAGLTLSAVAAAILWRERLQAWGWAGIALAMSAVALLNMRG